jgi:hypothetical protein
VAAIGASARPASAARASARAVAKAALRPRIAAMPQTVRFDVVLELRTFSGRCASSPVARGDIFDLL